MNAAGYEPRRHQSVLGVCDGPAEAPHSATLCAVLGPSRVPHSQGDKLTRGHDATSFLFLQCIKWSLNHVKYLKWQAREAFVRNHPIKAPSDYEENLANKSLVEAMNAKLQEVDALIHSAGTT